MYVFIYVRTYIVCMYVCMYNTVCYAYVYEFVLCVGSWWVCLRVCLSPTVSVLLVAPPPTGALPVCSETATRLCQLH